MTHIQFVGSLLVMAVVFFIVGALLGEAFNIYKRHKANKWRAIDFLIPSSNPDFDHTHITRSITVLPNSIQFTITCGDRSTTDTCFYHTVKGAKKGYVKQIREIEKVFFERNSDYIQAYKGDSK